MRRNHSLAWTRFTKSSGVNRLIPDLTFLINHLETPSCLPFPSINSTMQLFTAELVRLLEQDRAPANNQDMPDVICDISRLSRPHLFTAIQRRPYGRGGDLGVLVISLSPRMECQSNTHTLCSQCWLPDRG